MNMMYTAACSNHLVGPVVMQLLEAWSFIKHKRCEIYAGGKGHCFTGKHGDTPKVRWTR